MTRADAAVAQAHTVAAARRELMARATRRWNRTPELDARVLIGHALGLTMPASPPPICTGLRPQNRTRSPWSDGGG